MSELKKIIGLSALFDDISKCPAHITGIIRVSTNVMKIRTKGKKWG